MSIEWQSNVCEREIINLAQTTEKREIIKNESKNNYVFSLPPLFLQLVFQLLTIVEFLAFGLPCLLLFSLLLNWKNKNKNCCGKVSLIWWIVSQNQLTKNEEKIYEPDFWIFFLIFFSGKMKKNEFTFKITILMLVLDEQYRIGFVYRHLSKII